MVASGIFEGGVWLLVDSGILEGGVWFLVKMQWDI